MPATAGRVRMPANNRVHSSAALQTHGIWQSAIGYDPYAPNKEDAKETSQANNSEAGGENAYLSFQGLLQLARITNNTDNEVRGACKKCGRVGHLTFQCKNFVSLKDEIKDKDLDDQVNGLTGLDKWKASRKGKSGKKSSKVLAESSEESSDESDGSDSSIDPEIERIIAERFGKKGGTKAHSVKKKKKKRVSDDGDSDSDSGERKKRGRSKRRSSKKRSEIDSDSEDDKRRKRRREKRSKRDESSEDEERRESRRRKSRKEKRRRRSHRHSDDSDESPRRRHKRKSRRAPSPSDSDVSGSDDSRVGRDTKRADKKSHRRHHERDE